MSQEAVAENTSKRAKTKVEEVKPTQWTTSEQVSFGQTPSWATKKEDNNVPSWLSKQPTAPASFGQTASFGGGLGGGASSFGSSATFGGAATFGNPTNGGLATFGSVSGDSVFGNNKKREEKITVKETEEQSDEEGDEEEDGRSTGGDGNNEEPAPAEWGATAQDTQGLPPPEDVETGEENEQQLLQIRAKLFKLTKGDKPTWSEIGVGPVRINVPMKHHEEEKPSPDENPRVRLPRIIMRRQGVLKLLLNSVIVAELVFEPAGDNMLRFACESFTEDNPKGEIASFLLKFSREEERNRMLETLREVQPPKSS